MNQIEVWVFLHSIGHGIITVSARDTLGFRQHLPLHMVEFVPDPTTPRKGLIRMPRDLAAMHGLLPTRQTTSILGGRDGQVGAAIEKQVEDSMTATLQKALLSERERATGLNGNQQPPERKYRPARDSFGNEAGNGILTQHRARSQVEQIASELSVEDFQQSLGE